ncbi:hypothetical protein NIIDMKKI_24680 [Mycobacterium kansasii]|uniref:SnoaL-like domain-containing protein n=1 Tax=Mycobacterium kansasii TaxID=1768 RepID=A0A7G1IBL8_MYCKA|nr:hypothetical protein NIIDMKKI_24680 [Mycobacterium kansasii]
MDTAEWLRQSEAFLGAWNRHDVEEVVAWYTEPFVYRDPNIGAAAIESRDALRRYLSKLFDLWEMTWSVREVFVFDGADGAAVTWDATFRLRARHTRLEIHGVDIVFLRDGKVVHDEVFSTDRCLHHWLPVTRPKSSGRALGSLSPSTAPLL